MLATVTKIQAYLKECILEIECVLSFREKKSSNDCSLNSVTIKSNHPERNRHPMHFGIVHFKQLDKFFTRKATW